MKVAVLEGLKQRHAARTAYEKAMGDGAALSMDGNHRRALDMFGDAHNIAVKNGLGRKSVRDAVEEMQAETVALRIQETKPELYERLRHG